MKSFLAMLVLAIVKALGTRFFDPKSPTIVSTEERLRMYKNAKTVHDRMLNDPDFRERVQRDFRIEE